MENKSLDDILFSLPKKGDDTKLSEREEDIDVVAEKENSSHTIQIDSIRQATAVMEKEDVTEYSSASEAVFQDNTADSDETDAEEVTEEEYQQYLSEKKKQKKKAKSRKRHTRTFAHIFGGILLSVFIISISSFLAVYIIKSALDFTGIGKTYCQAQIYINDDATVDEVAEDLANLGIISMPDVFKFYTKLSDSEDDFIKGTFTVDTTMSYSTLLMTLQTVSTINQTVEIRITEGMRIDEIAEMMEENLVCRAEDFLAQCKKLDQTYKFQKRMEFEKLKYYQMEGYIFPDTYEFYIIPQLEDNDELDTTEYAAKVLDTIYQNFNDKITARYYNQMSNIGLTLDEVISLASVVQREADSVENMGLVASVFMNRLNESETFPRLESDVTVMYVDEQIKPHLSASQLSSYQATFDAYDTYTCDGIPVGAICNPGLDAIKAVLYAPETSYYYFCAHPETTEMYFAETISEHEENLRICGLDDAIAD